MKQKQTVIIDSGCANLSSVFFALKRLNAPVTISHDPEIILRADRIILPGVGTATEAMKNLKRHHLDQFLAKVNQPILGICLGMQLLGMDSEEGQKKTRCLGFLPTQTKRIKGGKLPVPHMGWNQVCFTEAHPLLANIPNNSYFYFVHSYAMPVEEHSLAWCHYQQSFSAIVCKPPYFGVQFHPERSGKMGAQILKNFLEME